ncbi:hypothetical protein AB7C87_06385 [Natrarchaeobius sp. A-rgal3]|uniref:hypothetical protein n=1 Tax=Natrarchaeobius versutus TaxID=1679078 RepID=UPI0035101E88
MADHYEVEDGTPGLVTVEVESVESGDETTTVEVESVIEVSGHDDDLYGDIWHEETVERGYYHVDGSSIRRTERSGADPAAGITLECSTDD